MKDDIFLPRDHVRESSFALQLLINFGAPRLGIHKYALSDA